MTAALADKVPRLSLSLLQAFDLRRNGTSVLMPMSSQRLLAFLALHERPVHRLHIAGKLWLDACEERAGANLRTTVWRLRHTDPALVEATATHIRVGRSVSVDVHETLGQARRLLDPTLECGGGDLASAPLTADLLPDWYDDWLLLEQERFRQIRLHALEALCERQIKAGHLAAAVEAGLAAVGGEPLRESAQRVLISAYLAEGNVAEALRQYRSYRRRLRVQLGLEPSPAIDGLVAAIQTHGARLDG